VKGREPAAPCFARLPQVREPPNVRRNPLAVLDKGRSQPDRTCHPCPELLLRTIRVFTEPQDVEAAEGVIYSTKPKCALTEDGRFVLKGPDIRVVFAESVCYELANQIGLAVPAHGVAFLPEDPGPWFACRLLQHRLPIERLFRLGRICNPDLIAQAAAFDIWTCNVDRNLGNIVAASCHDRPADVDIFAIDFEKAHSVRGELSRFEISALDTKRMWPLEDLGAICRTLERPLETIERIRALTDSALEGTIESVIAGLNFPDLPWRHAARDILARRRDILHKLVGEVWP
jgi:hypothetical protein